MDSHNIRLMGSAEIPSSIDEQKNIIIAGEFEHTSTNKRDLKDGGYKYTYSFAPVRLMKVEEGGAKVLLKTKNSNSTRLRGAIFHINPDEEYYDKVMNAIIANLEGVITFLDIK